MEQMEKRERGGPKGLNGSRYLAAGAYVESRRS